MDEKKLVDAPEYGGDGKKTDRCADEEGGRRRRSPGTGRRCRSLFYTGTAFPERTATARSSPSTARGTARRSRRGATASSSSRWPTARRRGEYETFADGFAALPDSTIQPGTAKHRPTGLAQAPDGALFVTDDAGGRIYRITYGSGAGAR